MKMIKLDGIWKDKDEQVLVELGGVVMGWGNVVEPLVRVSGALRLIEGNWSTEGGLLLKSVMPKYDILIRIPGTSLSCKGVGKICYTFEGITVHTNFNDGSDEVFQSDDGHYVTVHTNQRDLVDIHIRLVAPGVFTQDKKLQKLPLFNKPGIIT